MAEIHSLQYQSNDDALVHRLFDLVSDENSDRSELSRIDALVYAGLIKTYGEPEPPRLSGYGRVAA